MEESEPYKPMMSAERVERLRRWHVEGNHQLREGLPRHMSSFGIELDIPVDVFAPGEGSVLHQLVRDEIRPSDRVLDMGTGSGIGAILAAARSSEVLAVDINPKAVAAAIANAARNGVADRVTVKESDVFDAVDGTFDVVIFDPPFRWFAARDLLELSTADENYRTLRRFMMSARGYLRPGGRILLNFGTSGDIDYLHHLIDKAGFQKETLWTGDLTKDDLTVTYYVFRLTAGSPAPPGKDQGAGL